MRLTPTWADLKSAVYIIDLLAAMQHHVGNSSPMPIPLPVDGCKARRTDPKRLNCVGRWWCNGRCFSGEECAHKVIGKYPGGILKLPAPVPPCTLRLNRRTKRITGWVHLVLTAAAHGLTVDGDAIPDKLRVTAQGWLATDMTGVVKEGRRRTSRLRIAHERLAEFIRDETARVKPWTGGSK